MRGIVTCFKADEGWGALASPEVPSDVWVHFSVIDAAGYREFEPGDVVEFEAEEARQDGFQYRATRAALIAHGPAPELRHVRGSADGD